MELISLHNHTVFCDGKDTMEDYVLTALKTTAEAIGFSGHSHLPFDERYCMTHESEIAYNKEFDRLKKLYGGRIKLYRGIEADFFGDSDLSGYDYVIGSAHFIFKDGAYLEIDESKATAVKNVEELLPYDKIFEMNSGVVSRGYRKEPYIGTDILKYMKEHNVRMTVSADAHQACNFRFFFDETVEILKTAGYREVWEFDGKEFVPFAL